MVPAEFLANAATLTVFLIPLIAALWKIFDSIAALRERFNTRLDQIAHSAQIIELEMKALQDKGELAINGLREKHDHSINRLKNEFELLDRKVEQLEGFLAKTSGYEIRH